VICERPGHPGLFCALESGALIDLLPTGRRHQNSGLSTLFSPFIGEGPALICQGSQIDESPDSLKRERSALRFCPMTLRNQSGFTILEIMIAIVVLAIFLTLAVPSFQAALQNNRLTSATNGFVTAMQFARSEAISRRAPVTVCGSSDGSTCNDDWETGWIVFLDDNNEGTTAAVVDEVIRVWPTFAGGATNAGDAPNFIRFLGSGLVDGAAGTTYPVEFALEMPGCTGDNARIIEIERTGRVSAQRTGCS